MTHTIPINWDELEIALTMNLQEQSTYLDLRTGQVEMAANDFTGNDVGLSEEEVEAGFSEGYLVRIEPLPSSVEYGWMADFAETVADRRLREMLALNGRGAFRRFKDTLSEYPAERERWFAFRDERLRREIKEWLADHDIEHASRRPKSDLRQSDSDPTFFNTSPPATAGAISMGGTT